MMRRIRDGYRVFVLLLAGVATAQDKPVRVLYVEDVPRWEYRYLKNALLRADQRIRIQSWLAGASADFEQAHSKGLPALRALPKTAAELAAFDVILIGDVPRRALGETAQEQAAWCKAVVAFVEAGGGVGFLAGDKAMPDVYRGLFDQTLMPVILEPMEVSKPKFVRAKTGFRPVPAVGEDARLHPVLRVDDDTGKSAAAWQRVQFRTYVPVRKLKAGATALLEKPADEDDRTRRVLAATSSFGKGRTLFVATDETWLLRKPFGERYHDRFWRNVVLHLASRTLEDKKNAQADSPETVRRLLAEVAKRHGDARTIAARYRQERSTALLKRPLVSHGDLALRAKPPCLVFRSAGQNGTIIRLTRTSYEVLRPRRRTLERTPLANPALPDALFRAFRPEPGQIERDFTFARIWRTGGLLHVRMKPKKDAGARFLKDFSLAIDPETNTLKQVAYRDPQDDLVVLILQDLTIDPKLPPTTFDLTIPKGTKVLTHKPVGK